MRSYNVIGLMSGTSLDGLDIVLCNFSFQKKWNYKILSSQTIEYTNEWRNKLAEAPNLDGIELTKLHKQYGKFIGKSVLSFIQNTNVKVDFIASHGHTVFHQPDQGLTLQIGDGIEIASTTQITSISDFRSKDVALGGQGAPLVPIGDEFLFSEYDFCLNLGGFANISYNKNGMRLAYDICPANIVLNFLANKLGQTYDKNGALGFLGKLNAELLDKVNSIEYYIKEHPKSLGKEWLENIFIPIVEESDIPLHDKLRTIYEHVATQVSIALENSDETTTLVTGGGAYNKLLINLIKQKTNTKIVIPENSIVDFKEAIIFAFLGVLRFENEINCLSSVTGAIRDSSSGVIHIP